MIVCTGATPVMSSALAKSHPVLPAMWLMIVSIISYCALIALEARRTKRTLASDTSLDHDHEVDVEIRPTQIAKVDRSDGLESLDTKAQEDK